MTKPAIDSTNYAEILEAIAEPSLEACRWGRPPTTLRAEDGLFLFAAAAMVRNLAGENASLRSVLAELEWEVGRLKAAIGP